MAYDKYLMAFSSALSNAMRGVASVLFVGGSAPLSTHGVKFICPAPLSRDKGGPRPSPVEGRAWACIIKARRRPEKSPLKTPALRHFQIRGRRMTGPHFALFGMRVVAAFLLFWRTRRYDRCAYFTREPLDAPERAARPMAM